MKLRDRVTGQIYTSLFEVQLKFPTVSFPNQWDTSTYNFVNMDPVVEVPQPTVGIYNRADYLGVQLVNGIWTDVWQEVPLYDNPTEQAQWVLDLKEAKWEDIRVERNKLIAETDYTQLPDTPITPTSKAAFATYRQQLRDVTNQSDPYNIVWPTTPVYQKE